MCKYNEQCASNTIFYGKENEYIFFNKFYVVYYKLENNYWNSDYKEHYETYFYNDGNYGVYVYQLEDKKYFVSVNIAGDGKIDNVKDNTDGDFELLKLAYDPSYKIYNFYGKIINDFDNYEVKINDEKIEFTDNKINLNVDFSVEKADVVVKLQNDEDKYEVYGGEVLMPGINTVTIIVTRKNETTYRYDINIKRPETSNYLSSVEIKNSSIKFDKNKNNYTINVDKDTNKLDLIAKLEDKNATMKITGNSNLKNGSKVEIKVTDTKGNTNTYVITVKKSDARYIKIIIIIVALLSALTVGYKLVQNKKRN